MAVKECKNCKSKGPFNKDRNKKDGLSFYCTVCERAKGRLIYQRWRQKSIDLLGGVCVKCGFSDPRALQIDHIHGGGRQERLSIANGGGPNANKMYQLVAADVNHEKYQLLCANCNVIKRIENGEH